MPIYLRNTKPGGWIELQEAGGALESDDGTLKSDSGLLQYWNVLLDLGVKLGMDFQVGQKLGPLMEAAGYVNVQVKKFKIPIGPWAKVSRPNTGANPHNSRIE